MNQQAYVPPTLQASAFNCARCGVYAMQKWYYLSAYSEPARIREMYPGFDCSYENKEFLVSDCISCGEPTIWHDQLMIYPLHSTAERPSPDLPPEVLLDVEEARLIANLSPRGAAALLRLAIQKLCAHLGQPGKNINTDIAALVEAGLPVKVQQALDTLRVIGNEAVHPGELDLRDDSKTVVSLFRLVNFITEKMITEPAQIDAIYGLLPESKRDAIKKRDIGS
jgi:hypothetical protein